MSVADWQAVWLTLKLAASTTCVLMLFSPWLAWWLARSQSRIRPLIESLVSLPLVLPPTVLGFYLLLAFSPQSLPGSYWQQLTGQTLAFSFSGLVIASVLYSLPFAVQPLQSAFVNMGDKELNAARTLGFNGIARFRYIVLPMSFPSFIIAAALSFAHTIGEFGVVLMIGGNIPGQTQVLSIALFDHVEAMDYQNAHTLSAGLLLFSIAMLTLVYGVLQRRQRRLLIG
ncbi:MAG: molybdate ABC transporter permease subunit [Plesiomonas sp.]|uniref:molybdate ABC transporter permease subunit n=1 Tax=Plesiomonas sp. TaxID=2486279 RepID=UPI003F3F6E6B